MALFDFKHGNGPVQHSIDTKFPRCPLCGTPEPYWGLKYSTGVANGGKVQFRCDECGSILSITGMDLSGFSRHSKNPLLNIYVGPAVALNAGKKVLQRKKVLTTYVKIESTGNVKNPPFAKGQELPLEDLQQYIGLY